MPADRGPGVDQSLVERVKLLRENGTQWATIAKQCGIHVSTARRYAQRIDDTPEQEETRNEERIRCITDIYTIVHKSAAALIIALDKGELKPKELSILWGIGVDKIPTMEALINRGPKGNSDGNAPINFSFISIGANDTTKLDGGPLANTAGLSHVIEPIQGDDMRPGGGQDIQRLPGGCADGAGVPQEPGRDSSQHV